MEFLHNQQTGHRISHLITLKHYHQPTELFEAKLTERQMCDCVWVCACVIDILWNLLFREQPRWFNIFIIYSTNNQKVPGTYFFYLTLISNQKTHTSFPRS